MIVALSSLNGSDRLRDMLAALTHVRLPAGTTIHAFVRPRRPTSAKSRLALMIQPNDRT